LASIQTMRYHAGLSIAKVVSKSYVGGSSGLLIAGLSVTVASGMASTSVGEAASSIRALTQCTTVRSGGVYPSSRRK
jgi:hypothetical protein